MPARQLRFKAMGSPCQLHLHVDSQARFEVIAEAALAEVARLERKYSRYRDDSLASRINACAGDPDGIDLDQETASLLDYAALAWAQSGGLFDISSGVLRRAWNFRSGHLPARDEIARCGRWWAGQASLAAPASGCRSPACSSTSAATSRNTRRSRRCAVSRAGRAPRPDRSRRRPGGGGPPPRRLPLARGHPPSARARGRDREPRALLRRDRHQRRLRALPDRGRPALLASAESEDGQARARPRERHGRRQPLPDRGHRLDGRDAEGKTRRRGLARPARPASLGSTRTGNLTGRSQAVRSATRAESPNATTWRLGDEAAGLNEAHPAVHCNK